eukprot:1028512-Rhodomonas_salina.1
MVLPGPQTPRRSASSLAAGTASAMCLGARGLELVYEGRPQDWDSGWGEGEGDGEGQVSAYAMSGADLAYESCDWYQPTRCP